MKKTLILFIILFLMTALIPFSAALQKNKSSDSQELVTIFSSTVEINKRAFSECP